MWIMQALQLLPGYGLIQLPERLLIRIEGDYMHSKLII